jgi:hypothetical protein
MKSYFFPQGAHYWAINENGGCAAWLRKSVVGAMIEGCVNACFEKFLMGCFRGSDLGGVLPLRLNWQSLRGVVGLCVLWKFLRVGTRKRAELNHESCRERVRLVGANWQYCWARKALSNEVFARRGRVLLARFWGGCARPPLAGATKGITIDLSTND